MSSTNTVVRDQLMMTRDGFVSWYGLSIYYIVVYAEDRLRAKDIMLDKQMAGADGDGDKPTQSAQIKGNCCAIVETNQAHSAEESTVEVAQSSVVDWA